MPSARCSTPADGRTRPQRGGPCGGAAVYGAAPAGRERRAKGVGAAPRRPSSGADELAEAVAEQLLARWGSCSAEPRPLREPLAVAWPGGAVGVAPPRGPGRPPGQPVRAGSPVSDARPPRRWRPCARSARPPRRRRHAYRGRSAEPVGRDRPRVPSPRSVATPRPGATACRSTASSEVRRQCGRGPMMRVLRWLLVALLLVVLLALVAGG